MYPIEKFYEKVVYRPAVEIAVPDGTLLLFQAFTSCHRFSDAGLWYALHERIMTTSPHISAIVVARDRVDVFRECIQSILLQSETCFELLIVLNEASAQVKELVDGFSQQDQRLKSISSARVSASAARNLGVRHTTAPVLYFLDDDVSVPEHGFATLLERIQSRPEIAIIGGPNLTPHDDPLFAQRTGAVLASPWGTGITHSRYAGRSEGPALERDLILCNLGVRRSVFDQGICFPRIFGGEENVIAGKVEARGLLLWYCPKLYVYHRRRRTYRSYIKQVYRYGWGRANAIVLSPRNAHPLYFVPVVFALYLFGLPGLILLDTWILAPLLVYIVCTAIASLAVVRKHRQPTWFAPLLVLFPLTHVAYGVGLARQLLWWFFRSISASFRQGLPK